MAGINTGRVVAGGLVAGVVMNISDFVSNVYILAQDMKDMMQKLNLDAAAMEKPTVMATWILIDFLFGILLVWTYAAIRPRFGPGPKTAIYAGLTLYLAVTFVMYGMTTMGLMSVGLFIKSSALSLVTVILGSLVGGAVYKEAT